MFGAGAAIKAIAILLVVAIFAAGLWYATGLRADLAISQMNNAKLEEGIKQQQDLMDQMRQDVAQMQSINNDLRQEADRQRKEVQALTDRFNTNARGETRDFGALAAEKPAAIERAVNRGTKNAMRCLEIASGAPLTEQELNAKTNSEINRECPTLANPNYIPPIR
jgi:TolA-binding protein